MELAASLLLGVGLAAAVGFRIFIPLLAMSLAVRADMMQVTEGFVWIASTPSLFLFCTAAIVEILAYYIPWIDNLLDGITTPLAMICGTLVMASTIVEMEPWIKWTLAVIAGGGTAGLVKGTSVATRAASTTVTAGFGNPIVSSVELFASGLLSLLVILLPVLGGISILIIIAYVLFRFKKRYHGSI